MWIVDLVHPAKSTCGAYMLFSLSLLCFFLLPVSPPSICPSSSPLRPFLQTFLVWVLSFLLSTTGMGSRGATTSGTWGRAKPYRGIGRAMAFDSGAISLLSRRKKPDDKRSIEGAEVEGGELEEGGVDVHLIGEGGWREEDRDPISSVLILLSSYIFLPKSGANIVRASSHVYSSPR